MKRLDYTFDLVISLISSLNSSQVDPRLWKHNIRYIISADISPSLHFLSVRRRSRLPFPPSQGPVLKTVSSRTMELSQSYCHYESILGLLFAIRMLT
eukprot:scaffold12374_cov200-Alexandrium_tamarense.AAC.6